MGVSLHTEVLDRIIPEEDGWIVQSIQRSDQIETISTNDVVFRSAAGRGEPAKEDASRDASNELIIGSVARSSAIDKSDVEKGESQEESARIRLARSARDARNRLGGT